MKTKIVRWVLITTGFVIILLGTENVSWVQLGYEGQITADELTIKEGIKRIKEFEIALKTGDAEKIRESARLLQANHYAIELIKNRPKLNQRFIEVMRTAPTNLARAKATDREVSGREPIGALSNERPSALQSLSERQGLEYRVLESRSLEQKMSKSRPLESRVPESRTPKTQYPESRSLDSASTEGASTQRVAREPVSRQTSPQATQAPLPAQKHLVQSETSSTKTPTNNDYNSGLSSLQGSRSVTREVVSPAEAPGGGEGRTTSRESEVKDGSTVPEMKPDTSDSIQSNPTAIAHGGSKDNQSMQPDYTQIPGSPTIGAVQLAAPPILQSPPIENQKVKNIVDQYKKAVASKDPIKIKEAWAKVNEDFEAILHMEKNAPELAAHYRTRRGIEILNEKHQAQVERGEIRPLSEIEGEKFEQRMRQPKPSSSLKKPTPKLWHEKGPTPDDIKKATEKRFAKESDEVNRMFEASGEKTQQLPPARDSVEEDLQSAFQSNNQKKTIDAVRKVGRNNQAVDRLNKLEPEMIKLRERYVKVKENIIENTKINLKQRLAKRYGVSPNDVEVLTKSTKKAHLDQTGGVPRAGHDVDFGATVKKIEVDHNALREELARAYGDAVSEKNMDAVGLARDNIKAMSRLSPERISDLNILENPKDPLQYPHATGEDLGNKVYRDLSKSRISASKGNFTASESQKFDAYRELNKIGKIARERFATGNGKLSKRTKESLELIDDMINPKYPGDKTATPKQLDEALSKRGETIDSLTNKVISNVQGSEVLRPPGQQVSDKVRMDEFVERVKGNLELKGLERAPTGKFEPVDTSRGHANTKTGYEDLRKTGGKSSFQNDLGKVTSQAGRGHANTPTGYEDLHQKPVDKKTGLRGKSSFQRSPKQFAKKVASGVLQGLYGGGMVAGGYRKEAEAAAKEGRDFSKFKAVENMGKDVYQGSVKNPFDIGKRAAQEELKRIPKYEKEIRNELEASDLWKDMSKKERDQLVHSLARRRAETAAVGKALKGVFYDGTHKMSKSILEEEALREFREAKAAGEGNKLSAWRTAKYKYRAGTRVAGELTMINKIADALTYQDLPERQAADMQRKLQKYTKETMLEGLTKTTRIREEIAQIISDADHDNPATVEKLTKLTEQYDEIHAKLIRVNERTKGKVDAKDPFLVTLQHAVGQIPEDPFPRVSESTLDQQISDDVGTDEATSSTSDATVDGDKEEKTEQKNPFASDADKKDLDEILDLHDQKKFGRDTSHLGQKAADASAQSARGDSDFSQDNLGEELEKIIVRMAPPERCSHNSDCPAGYHCRNRMCVPDQCGQNSDCPYGYVCRDGSCMEIRPDEKPDTCGKNSDCPYGYVCRDSSCVEIRPDEKPDRCDKNSDCPYKYVCRDGSCVEIRPDEKPDTCGKNSDCPYGYVCRDSLCVEIRPDTCGKNSDCPVDYACRSGNCVKLRPDKIPASCRKNSDCPEQYKCRDSVCVPYKSKPKPPKSCSRNSDCPDDYVCKGGRCVKEEKKILHTYGGAFKGKGTVTANYGQRGSLACPWNGSLKITLHQNGAVSGQKVGAATFHFDDKKGTPIKCGSMSQVSKISGKHVNGSFQARAGSNILNGKYTEKSITGTMTSNSTVRFNTGQTGAFNGSASFKLSR